MDVFGAAEGAGHVAAAGAEVDFVDDHDWGAVFFGDAGQADAGDADVTVAHGGAGPDRGGEFVEGWGVEVRCVGHVGSLVTFVPAR